MMLVRNSRSRESLMILGQPKFTLHSLPSNMGRRILLASLAGGQLIIGTAHLESMANEEMRVAQLRVIGELLNPGGDISRAASVIFAGDTNFGTICPEAAEASRCLECEDIWVNLHGLDSAINTSTMLREESGRLDKVYFRKGTGEFEMSPTSIGLIGRRPVASVEQLTVLRPQGVFPSDHAGILSAFSFKST